MIVTDQFVFIHEPKTGGTFVRRTLDELYSRKPSHPRMRRLLKRKPVRRRMYKDDSHYHGTCHDIPASERGKPILSIIRNPFDLYVSFYHYGWWHTHPEDSYDDFELVMNEFPGFPNLSFEEFVHLANTRFGDFRLVEHKELPHDKRPGWYSTRFVRYYFKNPREMYPLINDEYIANSDPRKDMFDVHFMRTHSLNEDLYRFLGTMGFASKEIEFVLDRERVRPEWGAKPRPDDDWRKCYTPALEEYVLEKERLLFSLFPDLLDAAPSRHAASRNCE